MTAGRLDMSERGFRQPFVGSDGRWWLLDGRGHMVGVPSPAAWWRRQRLIEARRR